MRRALLTGRWLPTALTGLWVISLAIVLGIPDGIWASPTHPEHFAVPQRASRGMRARASGVPQPVTGSQPGPAW